MHEKTLDSKQNGIDLCVWVAACILGGFAILVLAVTGLFSIPLESISYPCWIHSKIGLYCPGCGGTRAFLAVLHGRFLRSLYYHPVVPYMGVIYVLFLEKGILHYLSRGKFAFMRFRLGYVYVGIAITIVQFLIKNICLIGFHIVWMS